MLKYAEEHALEMEFNAIFSQLALAARLKYPLAKGTVEEGMPMGSKLKKKRKVIALQILESQLLEVAKQKSPVLPSDKSPSGIEVERSSEILREGISEAPMEFAAQASPKRQKQTTEVPRK
jgi:hypothetical protein